MSPPVCQSVIISVRSTRMKICSPSSYVRWRGRPATWSIESRGDAHVGNSQGTRCPRMDTPGGVHKRTRMTTPDSKYCCVDNRWSCIVVLTTDGEEDKEAMDRFKLGGGKCKGYPAHAEGLFSFYFF